MKISKQQVAGIALIVAALFVVVIIQASGHGYTVVVTHPGTPPEQAAKGITVDGVIYRHFSLVQLSMLIPALAGIVLALLPRRDHAA